MVSELDGGEGTSGRAKTVEMSWILETADVLTTSDEELVREGLDRLELDLELLEAEEATIGLVEEGTGAVTTFEGRTEEEWEGDEDFEGSRQRCSQNVCAWPETEPAISKCTLAVCLVG